MNFGHISPCVCDFSKVFAVFSPYFQCEFFKKVACNIVNNIYCIRQNAGWPAPRAWARNWCRVGRFGGWVAIQGLLCLMPFPVASFFSQLGSSQPHCWRHASTWQRSCSWPGVTAGTSVIGLKNKCRNRFISLGLLKINFLILHKPMILNNYLKFFSKANLRVAS